MRMHTLLHILHLILSHILLHTLLHTLTYTFFFLYKVYLAVIVESRKQLLISINELVIEEYLRGKHEILTVPEAIEIFLLLFSSDR